MRLDAVWLTGTPLQIGFIYECLVSLSDKLSVLGTEENHAILEVCRSMLEKTRNAASSASFEYTDPDREVPTNEVSTERLLLETVLRSAPGLKSLYDRLCRGQPLP